MFVCKTRHLVLAGGSKVRWAWWHSVCWPPGSAVWSSLASGVTQMGLMSIWTGGQLSVSGPRQIVKKKKGFEILICLPNHLFIQFYGAPVRCLTLELRQ